MQLRLKLSRKKDEVKGQIQERAVCLRSVINLVGLKQTRQGVEPNEMKMGR